MITAQISKKNVWNIVKIAGIYCIISAAFSVLGIFLVDREPLPLPTGALSMHEVSGHILWGLVAGAATLSFRYTILAGLFAILIDSDHLIAYTHLDAISRISHSFAFGIISTFVLLVLFGKKDYKLGAIALAGLLSHISFDIFAGDDSEFPLYAPFYNQKISFPNQDWIFFEIAAVTVVVITMLFVRRKESRITV